ncbi:hypothetical protein [Streptomyces misionensis]|uniref:hypothetical protein n=1 Tax=Streptomyces misionensis TaxID=67331 RepID=UPI003BB21FAE
MTDGDVQARRRDLQAKLDQAQGVLSRIQAISDQHWSLISSSCQAMQAGAWFGPKARQFGAAVDSHQAELRSSLSEAVTSAQQKVADLRSELSGLR